jgi:hypothetical protein
MVLVKPLKEGSVRKEAPVKVGHHHWITGPATSAPHDPLSGRFGKSDSATDSYSALSGQLERSTQVIQVAGNLRYIC